MPVNFKNLENKLCMLQKSASFMHFEAKTAEKFSHFIAPEKEGIGSDAVETSQNLTTSITIVP